MRLVESEALAQRREKLAALGLMQLAKGDRLGLVAFAGSAFLQCPLTIDDVAFRQSVEALDVNTVSQGGTAVADAIESAQTAFKEGDNHRVLVLMSDGEDHDSGALEAAQKAAQTGLRIYTIGIGSAEGELIRVKDAQGHVDYIRDEQGNVVKSHLNERLLQEIAGATDGGFYLPLRGARTIDALYSEGLAKLPKSEHQEKLVKQYQDRYHWPLALAILALVVEMLLPERKREPKVAPARVRPLARPAVEAAAAVLLLVVLPCPTSASSSSALREYKAGKYDESLKEYEQLLQKNNDDPRLHFNAGAAAYRNRQFDEAARQFNDALASPDLKLQGLSYYNRGNAQYWLGEQNMDPGKRTDAWEKALKDYELSLKLNAQDPDAKFNHEFVKRKLEELKQQQQQQQQSQQNKSDQNQSQQQQQQQPQQQKNDSSRPNQNQQQAQQSQTDQKQNQSQQNQQAEQQKKDQQKQQAANQSQEQKEKQQAAQQAAQAKAGGDEKERKDAAAEAAGEMTAEQAQQLLDEQKGEEKMLPVKPEGKPTDHTRPIKDW